MGTGRAKGIPIIQSRCWDILLISWSSSAQTYLEYLFGIATIFKPLFARRCCKLSCNGYVVCIFMVIVAALFSQIFIVGVQWAQLPGALLVFSRVKARGRDLAGIAVDFPGWAQATEPKQLSWENIRQKRQSYTITVQVRSAIRSPLLGACNSHNKPMQWQF